jgi:cyclopropane fatty-acyl-phospholipid synthase-like methyltransferase
MTRDIDFYDGAYGKFSDDVLAEIRVETYGTDLGQSSWTTVDEYDTFCEMLKIGPDSTVLETASGSGGPALYMAEKLDCTVIGIDINREGVDNANELAVARGISNVSFQAADVGGRFRFDDESFDAIICIDAANHFPDRFHVLTEWSRVLKPGGRLLFTDPVVITGPVTNQDLFERSSIGTFVFIPPEVTEQFIREAGLTLIKSEDVTSNAALTSGRWHDARESHREAVLKFESKSDFDHLQTFLSAVHRLTSERRLSRFAFIAEK